MTFTLHERRFTIFGLTLWRWTVKRQTTNELMRKLLKGDR